MNHDDPASDRKLTMQVRPNKRWSSPLAKVYLTHAADLVRQGKYLDLARGLARTTGRYASRKASQWKRRFARSPEASLRALAVERLESSPSHRRKTQSTYGRRECSRKSINHFSICDGSFASKHRDSLFQLRPVRRRSGRLRIAPDSEVTRSHCRR